jgi:predicted dehydrogenase
MNQSVSRRRFFHDSLILSSALASLAIEPSATTAASHLPSSRLANEEISHAVLGCRIRGKVHAREFAKLPNVRISYLCDPDRELAAQLADEIKKEFGYRPNTVSDLREICIDENVHTVSIATPNHWHALAAIWAMQAGKDVYVEKPVCHTVVEGQRMVQAARKHNRICQAGTQNRSVGAHSEIVKCIAAGEIGNVDLARTIVYGPRGSIGKQDNYPQLPNVDYNLWLGPANQATIQRPQLHYDWHWVWDTGNGELGNNNIHYIDLVRWMLDLKGLGDSVLSLGGRVGYIDAGETPNTQLVFHRFGTRTIIQEVRGLKSNPYKLPGGWIIEGEDGIIAGTSLFDREGKLIKTFVGENQNHFENFITAVRQKDRTILTADIEEAATSSSLCHIGNISYRLGAQVSADEMREKLLQQDLPEACLTATDDMLSHLQEHAVDYQQTPLTMGKRLIIDSETYSFIDPAANSLLTRQYRDPFVLPIEENL